MGLSNTKLSNKISIFSCLNIKNSRKINKYSSDYTIIDEYESLNDFFQIIEPFIKSVKSKIKKSPNLGITYETTKMNITKLKSIGFYSLSDEICANLVLKISEGILQIATGDAYDIICLDTDFKYSPYNDVNSLYLEYIKSVSNINILKLIDYYYHSFDSISLKNRNNTEHKLLQTNKKIPTDFCIDECKKRIFINYLYFKKYESFITIITKFKHFLRQFKDYILSHDRDYLFSRIKAITFLNVNPDDFLKPYIIDKILKKNFPKNKNLLSNNIENNIIFFLPIISNLLTILDDIADKENPEISMDQLNKYFHIFNKIYENKKSSEEHTYLKRLSSNYNDLNSRLCSYNKNIKLVITIFVYIKTLLQSMNDIEDQCSYIIHNFKNFRTNNDLVLKFINEISNNTFPHYLFLNISIFEISSQYRYIPENDTINILINEFKKLEPNVLMKLLDLAISHHEDPEKGIIDKIVDNEHNNNYFEFDDLLFVNKLIKMNPADNTVDKSALDFVKKINDLFTELI